MGKFAISTQKCSKQLFIQNENFVSYSLNENSIEILVQIIDTLYFQNFSEATIFVTPIIGSSHSHNDVKKNDSRCKKQIYGIRSLRFIGFRSFATLFIAAKAGEYLKISIAVDELDTPIHLTSCFTK